MGTTHTLQLRAGQPPPIWPTTQRRLGPKGWSFLNPPHCQHEVGVLPYDPPTSNIVEWKFAAYSWDGFESGSCTMLEAKYGYNTRLTHVYEARIRDDGTDTTRYRTIAQNGWESRAKSMFRKLLKQAGKQIDRLKPYGTPRIGLLWSFSSSDSLAFFNQTGGNQLTAIWRFNAMNIRPSKEY